MNWVWKGPSLFINALSHTDCIKNLITMNDFWFCHWEIWRQHHNYVPFKDLFKDNRKGLTDKISYYHCFYSLILNHVFGILIIGVFDQKQISKTQWVVGFDSCLNLILSWNCSNQYWLIKSKVVPINVFFSQLIIAAYLIFLWFCHCHAHVTSSMCHIILKYCSLW